MDKVCLVLIVEDDDDIRDTIASVLTDEGYAIAAAANGAEALVLLRSGMRPDLILLDLMMPTMNGWDFRAEQQKDTALADIPVVILSGDANVEDRANDLAAAGFVRKPVGLANLLGVVDRFC